MLYIVRSKVNPALVLCTNGEFMPQVQVGPGGYNAKIYKTRRGAERARGGEVRVEEYFASDHMITIVVAWVDERMVPNGKPFAADLGARPALVPFKEAKACVWVNNGKAADIVKAREYIMKSNPETGRVYVYESSESDPLGCARRDILAGKAGR